MRRWIGVGGGLLLGFAVGGGLACKPKVLENHRHLAEEYCRDVVDYWSRCSGSEDPWPEDHKQEKYDECFAEEQWDWTDECGDRYWAHRSCLLEVPCDRWPAVAGNEDNTFCQEEEAALYHTNECHNTKDHGG